MAEHPGVLFDVDGTLLDTNHLHALAWWQAMRDAGVRCIALTGGGIARADLEREGAVEVYAGSQDLLEHFDTSGLATLG